MGLVADSGDAVYHIPTVGEADHGNDGKPRSWAQVALRILGDATELSAAHADTCPSLGARVVGLGKKDADEVVGGCADMGPMQGTGVIWLGKGRFGWRRWQRVGCGFGGCLGQGSAMGTGSPTVDPLRVRIAEHGELLGISGRRWAFARLHWMA